MCIAMSNYKKHKSASFFESLFFATRGIFFAFTREPNMRRQSVVLIVVVLLSILLKVSLFELFIILILSFLVFAFELINSSIEALADALHPKRHKNIERAKDMAAGSVLLISLAALIYGLTVFIPKLIGTYLSLL